jgi:hypothetical protein
MRRPWPALGRSATDRKKKKKERKKKGYSSSDVTSGALRVETNICEKFEVLTLIFMNM